MPFPLAPWLNQPDYLGAMTRGATLGLDAQKMAQEGKLAAAKLAADQSEASGRLGLGYAQVGAGQQEAAANLELSKTKLGLDVNKESQLNDYRTRENDLREKGLDLKKIADGLKDGSITHIANKLIQRNPDGTVKILFDANEKTLDPLDHAEFNQAVKNRAKADEALKNTKMSPAEAELWRKQLQDAEATMTNIREKSTGKFIPTSSAFQSPNLPLSPTTFAPKPGFTPPPGSLGDMLANPVDTSLAPNGVPVPQSFRVGKYLVTPQ